MMSRFQGFEHAETCTESNLGNAFNWLLIQ